MEAEPSAGFVSVLLSAVLRQALRCCAAHTHIVQSQHA